jgi:ABC-type molybdenum transport system ATPase subunit/photorepair protein PhrA
LEVINSARAQRSGMQRLLVALHHLQEIRPVVMNRARAQRIGMQRLLVANHHVQEIRPVTARPGLLKPGGFCM